MKARILEQSEEHKWERFVENHPLATIHQTSTWGHFQEKIQEREKYWIIVIEENNEIIAGTLLVRQALPKGFYCWLYAPRGPLLDQKRDQNEQMNELINPIKEIAKQEKAIFLRVDPLVRSSSHKVKFAKFHQNRPGFQPDYTIIIDISVADNEILEQMKPKGRYNIRLAEKKHVQVQQIDPQNPQEFAKDLEDFYEVFEQTAVRDRFRGHDKHFYSSMITTLSLENKATLYLARYNSKPIAGIIVTYCNNMATYYYGASSNEHRNLMAPYLLQWHAIKDAKKLGYKYYDLFGISPPNAKRHPWSGVTEFKKKFGGHEASYQKPQEYAFKKSLYLLYRIYKKIR